METMKQTKLIQIRRQSGLSREAAARSIQISTSAWLSYETGQRIPSLSVAFRISRLLGMAVDELFYYPESYNM